MPPACGRVERRHRAKTSVSKMNNTHKRSAQDRSAAILGRERVSNGRVKTREDNPIRNRKGPGLNLLFLTDLEKLARGRRGFGTLTLSGAELILDDVIPRLAKRWRSGVSESSRLVEWARDHLPEIFEAHDEVWVESRRKEVMSWTSHRLHDVDFLAARHGITQDEVEGFSLCSLVSAERPERVRRQDERAYDRAYSQRRRGADPNHVPREHSLEARWRRQEFGDLTWEQLRYRIRKGVIDPNTTTSADSHFSSGTGVTVNRTDEKCENAKTDPGEAASENHENSGHHHTGSTMNRRSTFITLKPAAMTIHHGAGIGDQTALIDMSGLHTASIPIQGRGATETGAPIFYIPAISGTVVERAGR